MCSCGSRHPRRRDAVSSFLLPQLHRCSLLSTDQNFCRSSFCLSRLTGAGLGGKALPTPGLRCGEGPCPPLQEQLRGDHSHSAPVSVRVREPEATGVAARERGVRSRTPPSGGMGRFHRAEGQPESSEGAPEPEMGRTSSFPRSTQHWTSPAQWSALGVPGGLFDLFPNTHPPFPSGS